MLLLPEIKKTPSIPQDYSHLLVSSGFQDFDSAGGYLLAGPVAHRQPWVIHLSIVLPQLESMLSVVLPTLRRIDCRFSIPKDYQVAASIIDGNYSPDSYAKVVSIRMVDETALDDLVKTLIGQTSAFLCPRIHNAFHVAGIVFLTYDPVMPDDLCSRKGLNDGISTAGGQIQYHLGLPQGLSWPLTSVPVPGAWEDARWISDFLVLETVSASYKARTLFARRISLKRPFQPVIIKEGYANTVYDEHGRTITDRLRMQDRIMRILSPRGLSPRSLGVVETAQSTYLIVERATGQSFYQIIKSIHGSGSVLLGMPKDTIIRLLDQILAILKGVDEMHELGIIHRDLTPSNIIIGVGSQPMFIDHEISYDANEGYPDPVFTLGSPGFMSDEQTEGETPTVKEDVYALGGTIIMSLTGIWPTTLDRAPVHRQKDFLYFLIGDQCLVKALMKCRSPQSTLRPTISDIQSVLIDYKSKISKNSFLPHLNHPCSNAGIQRTATYIANVIARDMRNKLATLSETTDQTFSTGLSGMAYVLESAETQGLQINEFQQLKELYNKELDATRMALVKKLSKTIPDTADLLLLSLVEHYVQPTFQESLFFDDYKLLETHGPTLAGGLAGKIYLLLSTSQSHLKLQKKGLTNTIKILVDNQSRDGSWGIASSSGKQQKNTGVVNGNAGIVLCLLKYYNEFQDPRVLDAIKKGLSWLSLWVKVCPLPMNTRQRLASPWLKEGYTGVALTFLTADSILPGYRCLETAMSLLSTHPKFLNGTFLGFANGVSGIGLTLLDMFKSNNNDTWLKSSTWIASLISEFSVCNSQNDILWLADKQDGQDMSFMNGNAGILHFLINQIKNI